VGFEIAVQTVIYNALIGHAPLMLLVNGVYDSVPQDEEFPYVTIGEAIHSEDDTTGTIGHAVSALINCWTRFTPTEGSRGRLKTKQIQGEIFSALHRQNFSVAGYDVIDVAFEQSQSFVDQDGLTRHGVQNFRVIIQEV